MYLFKQFLTIIIHNDQSMVTLRKFKFIVVSLDEYIHEKPMLYNSYIQSICIELEISG